MSDQFESQTPRSHEVQSGRSSQEVAIEHPVGSVVIGEIDGIHDLRAFVTLTDGTSASIEVAEIPGAIEGKIDEVLRVGDIVEACVNRIDDRERIKLSIVDHLKQIEHAINGVQAAAKAQADTQQRLHRTISTDGLGILGQASETEEKLVFEAAHVKGRIQNILVIEDDENFLPAFVEWLEAHGYNVECAGTGEEGAESAISKGHDLVFTDCNLPGISGAETADKILRQRSTSQVVLVRGPQVVDEDATHEELLAYPGYVGMLDKPLDFEEVRRLMMALESGKDSPLRKDLHAAPERIEKPFKQTNLSNAVPGFSIPDLLKGELRDLQMEMQATCGLVFEMEPFSRRISLVASSTGVSGSDQSIFYDVNMQDLRYSPVKDVIRNRERIFDNTMLEREGKHKYLLRFLKIPVESCIGLPISVPEETTRYGLFLFDGPGGYFSKQQFRRVREAVRLIGLAIQTRLLKDQLHSYHNLMLRGQLSSALAHELGNQLGAVTALCDSLQLYCGRLISISDKEEGEHTVAMIQKNADDLSQASTTLNRVFKSYLGVSKETKKASVDVGNLIDRIVNLVSSEAKRKRVTIRTIIDKSLPKTQGVQQHLEQVFTNLFLNAIFHIGAKSDKGGVLVIKCIHDAKDQDLPIKVRVIDTGPGIHQQYAERIFEPGFSTREAGAGLGLSISRALIEDMGGRLSLELTIRFIGSSFLVELPATTAEVS